MVLFDLQETEPFRGIFSVCVQRRHWHICYDEASLVFSCHWNVPHLETGLRTADARI